MPQSGSDIVLIAATAVRTRDTSESSTSDTSLRRKTSRRRRLEQKAKIGRVRPLVPLSSFCMEPDSCATACEIWRRRRACQAESTPRSFLHAYLRAKAAVMFTPHVAYGMWMRWVNFSLQITRSAGIIYRHYRTRQLNLLCGGAHDSDAAGRRLGMSHSSSAASSPTNSEAASERANGVRPCHGHAQHYYIHVNITRCVVWRRVSADRCATHLSDPHAAVHPVEPNAINRTPTIVRRRDGRAAP